MPGVRQLELEHGSVIKGLLKKRKKAGKKRSGLPSMISFPAGMARLPEAMARQADILYNHPVTAVRRTGDQWEIQTAASRYLARTLVIAVTVNRSLALLGDFNPPLKRIPEARINNVVLGFDKKAGIPFGFGYLAPESEKRFALGALFSTHMFPGRAPEGRVMLEALVGGRRHPERLELDDRETIQKTYDDLRQLIHLPEPPCFSKVLRTKHGIPQLEIGYPELLAWRNRTEKENPGIHLIGFGWEGIGINDMTKAARRVAETIAGQQEGTDRKEVKGVYF